MKILQVNKICRQEKRNVVVIKTLYFMFDGGKSQVYYNINKKNIQ